ncbi:hypothetical protein [Nitrosopumilus sp.]|uniref:hypothetical protein n=1 Tax=Nitrosopumilus sp. TaxID=2024843 RepID=UPI00247ED3A0|nr:hypothetical protein [Nitrosopumilus sp.]MCV0409661.1 hypothetical protein [Nitrosopumilus sp.]
MDLLRINASKMILFIGIAVVMYDITNSIILSSKWDTSYKYLFVGGSVSAIGLIFMLIDSKDKIKQ